MEEILSTKEIANLIGITDRRIQQLTNEGVLKQTSRGKYNTSQTIQNYIGYQISIERKKFKKNDIDINEARRRREVAEAELKEIELSIKKNEIIEIEDIKKKWEKILFAVRSRLLEIPSKLAPNLVMNKQISVIQKKIKEEIYLALNELSNYKGNE